MKKLALVLLGSIIGASVVLAAPFNQTLTGMTASIAGYSASMGGDFSLALEIKASDGSVLITKHLSLPQAGKVLDERGRVVANAVPAAFTTARNAFETQIQTLFDAAVAGGKIGL